MFNEWTIHSMSSVAVFAGAASVMWQMVKPRHAAAWTSFTESAHANDPLKRPVFPRVASMAIAVFLGAMGFAVTGLPIMIFVGGWVGWSTPQRVLDERYSQLLHRLDRQLVEVVRDLNEGMAAGMNLGEAIRHTADRTNEPMKSEVARVATGLQMGERAEVAFAALSKRLGTDMARRLAEAIGIGLKFGGTLRVTLDNLERQMTERFQAFDQREAKTRSSRKNAKFIAGAVPAMIVLYLTFMGPNVTQFYKDLSGTIVLVLVLALVVMAQKWADKIAGEDRVRQAQEEDSND